MTGVLHMPDRYVFRRMTPDEFGDALRAAKMSRNDFMFVTGRHAHGVQKYFDPNDRSSPTLAEMVILALAAEDPDIRSRMMEIARDFMVDMGPLKDRR